MVSGLRGTNYEERLAELNLQSLEARRKMLDMVETYKITNGHTKLDRHNWFSFVEDTDTRTTRNRQYGKNLIAKRTNHDTMTQNLD